MRLSADILCIKVAIFLSLVAMPLISVCQSQSGKHALLIGISNYGANKGWITLASERDLQLTKAALIRSGFSAGNIQTLRDQAATRQGIINSFFALYQKVKPGDVVYIHISAHGQQLSDDDGDELDGWDESIVPYDAPRNHQYNVGSDGKSYRYDGSKHLRDDQLGKEIMKLRKKLGSRGHVLLVLDACHSGTGARGMGEARGAGRIVIDSLSGDAELLNHDDGYLQTDLMHIENSGVASFVMFAASQSNQLNYQTFDDEGLKVGSLSYSVSKVAASVSGDMTYRQFFAQVVDEMARKAPYQTPQMEGDADVGFLGGVMREQQPYIEVTQILSLHTVKLGAGTLSQVAIGTRVALETSGTRKVSASPLALGIVTSANAFESIVTLEKPLSVSQKSAIWAFITERRMSENPIALSLRGVQDEQVRGTLIEALQKSGFFKITNKHAELSLTQSTEAATTAQNIKFVLNDLVSGKQIRSLEIDSDAIGDVVSFLENFYWGRKMMAFDAVNPGYDVRVNQIVVGDDKSETKKEYTKGNGEIPVVEAGRSCYLEIKNMGTERAYYNVLLISQGAWMTPLFPAQRFGTSDPEPHTLVVDPGQVQRIPIPLSMEASAETKVIKIIASCRPFDLSRSMGPKLRTRGLTADKPEELLPAVIHAELLKKDCGSGTGTSEYVFRVSQ